MASNPGTIPLRGLVLSSNCLLSPPASKTLVLLEAERSTREERREKGEKRESERNGEGEGERN